MNTTVAAICAIVMASLLILFSIPLIMRAIPMNRDYGFRWPEAFKSNEDWQEINVFGGWCMLLANVPLLILAVFALVRPMAISEFFGFGLLVFWPCIIAVIVLTRLRAKKAGKKNG
jgi:ABC-type phosphate transport system permease subunit